MTDNIANCDVCKDILLRSKTLIRLHSWRQLYSDHDWNKLGALLKMEMVGGPESCKGGSSV